MNLDVRIRALAKERGIPLSRLSKVEAQKLALEAMTLSEKVIGAAKVAVAEAVNLSHTVSDAEYNYRLMACDECPYYLKDRGCLACGCMSRFETKLRSSVFSCPKGKW